MANFGPSAADPATRKNEFAQMYKSPANIIVTCDCDRATFEVLSGQRDASESTTAVADGSFQNRTSYTYLRLRGGEDCSLLIGMRDRSGGAIDCLNFTRYWHKKERTKANNTWVNRYSTAMVAHIQLGERLEHLGDDFNVMAVHMHNKLANREFGIQKLNEFYDWFAEYVTRYQVRVCMGDVNMAMFQIVTERRSRGLTGDVAAWTPYKTPSGKPRADSMAIMFLNSLGIYLPTKSPHHLHDRSGGFLAEGEK